MKTKLHILIVLLVSSFVTVSCEYYGLDLHGEDDEGRICVFSVAGVKDTTFVTVRTTRPINDVSPYVPYDKAQAVLRINDSPVFMEEWKGNSDPGKIFFTTAPVSHGDRLELSVTNPGLDAVHSVTTVPAPAPEFTVEGEVLRSVEDNLYEQVDPSGGYLYNSADVVRLRVTFRDDPSTEDHYAVQLMKYKEYIRDEGPVYVSQQSGFIVDRNALSARNDIIPIVDVSYIFGGRYGIRSVTYFNDAEFNGQDVTREYAMRHDDSFCYKIRLYLISEELYRSLESYFIWYSGPLSDQHLAPFYPYTNVINGLGCFASASVMESGLIRVQ